MKNPKAIAIVTIFWGSDAYFSQHNIQTQKKSIHPHNSEAATLEYKKSVSFVVLNSQQKLLSPNTIRNPSQDPDLKAWLSLSIYN